MAIGEASGQGRVEIVLPSILRSPQGGRAVQIRNLSAHGVMIVGESGLSPGDVVELQIPNLGWVDGRVAWSMDTRAGLAFNSPIDLTAALGSSVAAC